jgi:phenylalanyl-tRNA synthetase beta chain
MLSTTAACSGAIHARMAQAGETISLLNEQTLTLQPDILLISDDQRPVAMAGIMGDEASGITLATTEVFLESAFFAPAAIAGRARRYGFVSDASHRFERGVDFGGTRRALERATRLVIDICGGQAGPVSEASGEPARRGSRCACARRASPRCSGCR